MKNFINKIGLFITNIVRSLDNTQNSGYSARKLTALAIVICVIAGHVIYYKHCFTKEDFTIYATILTIDYFAIAFFLGLVTIEQIIKLKNGKEDSKTDI
jgi:hypothetical protein